MGQIRRDLPNDEYQAAIGANNPSASNVFATMADLPVITGDANRLVFDVKIDQVGGINKGQAVYVSGADGTNILVTKADNSSDATSSKTLGLLITTGANNAQRQVVAEGILKGTGAEPLDTSAAIAGDPVWLGTNGNLIYGLANKPYAPQHLVFIGVVVEANPTVGEIFVKVQNGYELEEIHDVDLVSNPPLDGEVLTYNALTSLWEPKPIPGVSSGGTQLLSGGASWSGTGMTFNVSTLTYTIDGVYYTSAPQNVTLAAGDPTNPRFDAIVVDAAGVVSVITGTPAANPIVPSIPGTQVLVQYVLVAAGATTPSVTNEFVYREGSTPDWTPTFVSSGPGTPLSVNFSSTTPTPFQGAQCTLVNAPTYNINKRIIYTKPSGSIARANFPFLAFRVRLLTGSANRNVLVRLFNGANFIGNLWANPYGLNITTLNTWQLVVIPLVAFGNAGQLNVTRVEFVISGTVATTTQVAFDDVKFQSGFGPQSSTATLDILQNGTIIGDTSKINFINGTNTTVTVTDDIPNNKIDVQINSATAANIYNSDGTLTGNRTLNGANFELLLDALKLFGVNLTPGIGINGYTISVNTLGMSGSIATRIFKVEDSNAGIQRFGINRNGNVIFNNAFTFPLADGTIGQALITDGGGVVNWGTIFNQQIQDETTNLPQRNIISFAGAGVTAADVGGKTVVTINGTSGSNATIQLRGTDPIAISGTSGGSTSLTLATFTNQLALALTQSGGSAATTNYWYQFVMPTNFASGGQLRIVTRRNYSTGTALVTLYIDGVASNISAVNCNPTVINTWETFLINLTTGVAAGASITVAITPTVQISGGTFYVKDVTFNYLS